MSRRISYTVPSRHPEKKQSVRAIKKYKKLIGKCIELVIQSPSISGDGYPKSRIKIAWPNGEPPKGFIKGKMTVENGAPVHNYSTFWVLLWLYEEGYTDFTPSRIFRERRAFLMQNTILENELESLLDIDIKEDYNVD